MHKIVRYPGKKLNRWAAILVLILGAIALLGTACATSDTSTAVPTEVATTRSTPTALPTLATEIPVEPTDTTPTAATSPTQSADSPTEPSPTPTEALPDSPTPAPTDPPLPVSEPVLTEPPQNVVVPTDLPNTIVVDPSVRHQTISGWEAVADIGLIESAEWSALAPRYRDQVADLALEVGINRVRLEATSGMENPVDYFTPFITGQQPRKFWRDQSYSIINDNDDPNVINRNGFQFVELDHKIDNAVLPLKSRLEARGERLYINLLYVDFGTSAFEHRDNPDEYGEFMLALFQHMETKYGFVPDAIELVLEPDNKSDDPLGWPSNTLGPALVAAGDRLKAAGYTPDFVAPSTISLKRAVRYFDTIIETPRALDYLSELSYHRYRDNGRLRDIAERSERYNIGASMLEWWHRKNTYATLHEDLKVGRNSAWQAKLLAFPGHPLTPNQDVASVDISNPNSPKAVLTHAIKYFRQYFKYVRSGAQRIEATSTNSNFDPLAFINTDGKYVVVVKSSSGGEFAVKGMPAGQYGIKFTTGDGINQPSQYDVDLPDAAIQTGEQVVASIPEAGIITIYRK